MVEFKENKKRLTINLSLFATNDQDNKSTKSPRNFEPNGVVGLGIVAAMNDLDQTSDPLFSAKSSRAAILAVSPRSSPIPIFSNAMSSASAKFGGAAVKFGGNNGGGGGTKLEEMDEMELSEGYTWVISHIGNNLIKRREYFDGYLAGESETTTSKWATSGLSTAYLPPPSSYHRPTVAESTMFWTADFLSFCFLCKKKLHGLDIFMYRGEKAFCSAECRRKQMSIDERREKFGSGVMKPLEYSIPPCSGPMQFFAGVAAADIVIAPTYVYQQIKDIVKHGELTK